MNKKKVVILDTSIFCVYLKVPDMDDCGSDKDKWNYARVKKAIDLEIKKNSTLVLPLAALVETGNHIAHANRERFDTAERLAKVIRKVANEEEPWAAFTSQSDLWNRQGLIRLSEEWPQLAARGIAIGDATIKEVAEYYANAGYEVEILTGDAELKAYQPAAKEELPIPRRRKG